VRRRAFISLLGGAAIGWPLVARAQQTQMRRVGVLFGANAAGDTEGQARIGAFRQAMELLGWTTGRNLQIEYRWGAADAANLRMSAVLMASIASRDSLFF
jgi:putative tryptophan/tyrosine transport system substrate-binding protein